MENKIPSKCKNCGSELWFNPEQGCLTCKYCESNYFLPKKDPDAVLVRQYSSGFHPNNLNQSLIAYKCSSCGNVYYMSSEEKSKTCANCGCSSSKIVSDNGFCADGIIPFKISKQEAYEKLVEYFREKGHMPKGLKDAGSIDSIQGSFIPVWNFTFNVDANYSANVGQVVKSSYGNYYSTTKPVFGDKFKRVNSHDECACKMVDTSFLELFDENDYVDIIPYIPEYTYGYKVEAINKDIHEFYGQITRNAEGSYRDEVKKEVLGKYKEVSDIQVDSRVDDVFFNFTYVPVYTYKISKKGKTSNVYISGTTGKVIQKSPVANVVKSAFKWLLLFAVLGLIAYIFWPK